MCVGRGGGCCKNTKNPAKTEYARNWNFLLAGKKQHASWNIKILSCHRKKILQTPWSRGAPPPSHFFSTSQPLNVHGPSQNCLISYLAPVSSFAHHDRLLWPSRMTHPSIMFLYVSFFRCHVLLLPLLEGFAGQARRTLLLFTCVKDVQKHLSSLKIAKTAALSEANLILARAGAVNL